jgi:DtxR family Mn-dependent transcriptional regulator
VSQHPPLEEYLEAVHELVEEGVRVTQARLAGRLGHAAPTVSQMVRRLAGEGYLTIEHRELVLTELGRTQAARVVRKHRLAERLLTDVIGLSWDKAHAEAGRWEHVISDEVEALLVGLLGNPGTCPHGNPIPGGPEVGGGAVGPLADCDPGDHIRFARVTEQVEIDSAALRYLAEHRFVPGTAARVYTKAADGTVVLRLDDNTTVALGPSLADQLFVATAP